MNRKSNRTILVVEDNVDLCEHLAESIEDGGYKTIVAYDGLEALEKIKNQDLDLLATDLRIPKLNGIEVILQLQKTPKKGLPIFIFSGTISATSVSKLRSLNVKKIFLKPFNTLELIDAIDELFAPKVQKIRGGQVEITDEEV